MHGVELLFLSLRVPTVRSYKKGVSGLHGRNAPSHMQRHLTVLAGLITAPVLGNGHAPGAHHRHRFTAPPGAEVCTFTVTVRAS